MPWYATLAVVLVIAVFFTPMAILLWLDAVEEIRSRRRRQR